MQNWKYALGLLYLVAVICIITGYVQTKDSLAATSTPMSFSALMSNHAFVAGLGIILAPVILLGIYVKLM